ncbi:MAG: biotin transporter BioY [Actinobacteria bacterium]|nr:biotin transporter BioY [Actinomycetota bacterium]
MVKVALMAALTAAGAWISIPLKPVPFTLQVFFVLLSGMALGANLGALSQVVYVLLGVIGLPVFAGGSSGFGALVGPTGGYLIGFIAAAYAIGRLFQSDRSASFVKVLSPFVGLGLIYALGVAQLSFVTGFGLGKALTVGVFPFVLFDLVKAVVAIIIAYRLGAVGIIPGMIDGAPQASKRLDEPSS